MRSSNVELLWQDLKYDKVVIWGHPLHTHTHSYIHNALVKAFNSLGIKCDWFYDFNYPEDYEWENTLFITEGFADGHIPIRETSTYLVMYCPDPSKYINKSMYIELRLKAKNFIDHVSAYNFDKYDVTNIQTSCGGVYLHLPSSNKIHFKNNYIDTSFQAYPIVYLDWAASLLPSEINYENRFVIRKWEYNFVGTLSKNGINKNFKEYSLLKKSLAKNQVIFNHYNPWTKPIDEEDLNAKIRNSLIGTDLRGVAHREQGLVTDRVFKNTSLGHLPSTNSKSIHEAMDYIGVFDENIENLVEKTIAKRFDYDEIANAMEVVRNKHTYIDRIEGIFKAITLVK